MDISVVIPLYNEDESIPELYAWIERVMRENNFSYEVIFINDGSTDRSWEIISDMLPFILIPIPTWINLPLPSRRH